MTMERPKGPDFYTIGWITALPIERAAATALLDETHEIPQGFDQHQSDTNSYTWGRMAKHNVVIASLPSGIYGTTAAATTASNLIASLPHIRIGLLVGIGGAISRPHQGYDIRLGDVIVSEPDGTTGGVVQYDLGRSKGDQTWERKGSLNTPPTVLLTALASLKAQHEIKGSRVPQILQSSYQEYPVMAKPSKNSPGYIHQGFENDNLFSASYSHPGGDNCSQCDSNYKVQRDQRDTADPEIHYGVIASGNTLVKDSSIRDSILEIVGNQCICVEMEAAGLMNHFPCLVIRGVCDYADSHKNDRWQRYASMTAAAFGKEFLDFVQVRNLETTPRVVDVLHDMHTDIETIQFTAKNIHATVLDMDHKAVLDRLPIASGASFDSRAEAESPTCLQDTRVKLLEGITLWSHDPSAKAIFWLQGMAGTGKSTVSRTVSKSLAASGHLGASFFFKRADGSRGTSSRLFTTVASQLAVRNPAIAPHIRKAIEVDSAIGDKGLREQFSQVILEPLLKIPLTEPLVLVIDALDECEAEDHEIKLAIRLFSQIKRLGIRTFVTSRPELPIRLGFYAIGSDYQEVVLHEIPEPVIKHDLTVFLRHRLTEIRLEYNASVPNNGRLLETWPGDRQIQRLVEMAYPLFIFASTICHHLEDYRGGNPNDQLQEVLSYQSSTEGSQLDATYLPVLDKMSAGLSGQRRKHVLERFQLVVGSIVVLAYPVSIPTLAQLLSVHRGILDSQLSMLHSVLNIPQSDESPIRLLHLSFQDFLLDPTKKGYNDFWVDKALAHSKLAVSCLHVLSRFLHKDMCELVLSGRRNASIAVDEIDNFFPAEVQYACLHWVFHCQAAQTPLKDDGDVYVFLQRHLLHWIEALSLMHRESECVRSIKNLQSLTKAIDAPSLSEFLSDSLRVVQANISVLRIAPLQLYSSALLFTPKNSVIRSRFSSHIPPCISVHPRTEQDWGQHILTLEDHSQEVTHVSFSSDSSILATGSKDDTIRLCDTNTGKRIRSLRSYGRVSATAFSHDMALLAVASCMSDISQWMSSKTNKITVRLWRVDTGEFIWSSRCYEDGKFYLGFGPENVLLICSASKDKTVWLRCANNGHCIQEVVESDSCVTSVAFSQDSELTASANTNRIIRLQNFIDHDDHVKLKSHSNYVTAMRFSNDSKILASGCSKTICLWHVDTGECIRKLDHTTHGDTLLFSHDLTLAVSVLVDGSIHRWRVDTGEALQTLDPPEGSSIALSHDLGLIATGSRIGTVRLWHATSTIGVRSHINHKKQVSRIVFSPDSAYLASLASNNDIRIWRVDTGEQLRQFRSGTGSVSSLIFSNDSRLIASVAADRRVRVWEVHTGMRIQVFDLEFVAGDEALNFSHDSKTIFLTWLGGWHTWCVETGKHQVRYLALKSKWNRSALSPDSKLLAFSTPYQTAYGARGASPADNFSSIYGAVSLYSVKTGESISTIRQFIIPLNFSDDSKILVTFNQDTIQLWSTETWRFIRSVNIRGITSFLNFQPSTNTLTTQFGAFVQGSLSSSFRGSGYGFSRDYQWVMKDGTGVLWLPPEYRPCNSAVQGHVIAYGCTSGSVYVLAFSD